MKSKILVLFLFIVSIPVFSQNQYYVKTDGQGDGLSWASAMSVSTFSSTLSTAPSGSVFHIAAGVYLPVSTDGFKIYSDITLIGGYPADASEGALSEPEKYQTVFDGDLAGDDQIHYLSCSYSSGNDSLTVDNNQNNVERLFEVKAIDVRVSLKGITFTNAFTYAFNCEEGTKLTVEDCRFERNAMLAISMLKENAELTVKHSFFYQNAYSGGVVIGNLMQGSKDIEISDCIFQENGCYGKTTGSVIYTSGAKIQNSTFYKNRGESAGVLNCIGTMENKIEIQNCTFVENVVTLFGGVISIQGLMHLNITNNTFLNNTAKEGGSSIYQTNPNSVLTLTGNIFADSSDKPAVQTSFYAGIKHFESQYNIFTKAPSYYYEDNMLELSTTDILLSQKDLVGVLDGTYNTSTGVFTANLQDNGGSTPTVALVGTELPNGKVINSLPLDVSNVTTDQRGVERHDLACIGAYEYDREFLKEYYVKMTESGIGDGSSWENAMSNESFAEVLPKVPDGVTFHIAEGTYKPIYDVNGTFSENVASRTFGINSSVTLIGGYPADAQTGAVSDPVNNKTVFDGNVEGDTVNNLIYAYLPSLKVSLTGLDIENTKYNAIEYSSNDSELYFNNVFVSNSLGYAVNTFASILKIENSSFYKNNGVINAYNPDGKATMKNVTINENKGSTIIYCYAESFVMDNVKAEKNIGQLIYFSSGKDLSITNNSIFEDNQSDSELIMSFASNSFTITDSKIANNTFNKGVAGSNGIAGIYNSNYDANLTLSKTIIDGNKGKATLCSYAKINSIDNCIFSNNTNEPGDDLMAQNPRRSAVVLFPSQDVEHNISNSTFDHNFSYMILSLGNNGGTCLLKNNTIVRNQGCLIGTGYGVGCQAHFINNTIVGNSVGINNTIGTNSAMNVLIDVDTETLIGNIILGNGIPNEYLGDERLNRFFLVPKENVKHNIMPMFRTNGLVEGCPFYQSIGDDTNIFVESENFNFDDFKERWEYCATGDNLNEFYKNVILGEAPYLALLDGTYDESTGLFNPNLKDNGGFTPTVALIDTKLPNGKVINSLPLDVSNVTTDQRGVERHDLACIGAYEYDREFLKEYYVKMTESGIGDGSSWENAMSNESFAEVLPKVPDGVTFHIAEGTYHPMYDLNGNIPESTTGKTFTINSNVTLIGGYPANATTGNEPSEPEKHKTVFEGDIDGEKANNMVYANLPSLKIHLTGLHIENTESNAIAYYSNDSELYLDNVIVSNSLNYAVYATSTLILKIENSSFYKNNGAIGTYNSAGKTILNNVQLEENFGNSVISCGTESFNMNRIVVKRNTAQLIYAFGKKLTIENSEFEENQYDYDVIGTYLSDSLVILDSKIANNISVNGVGGMYSGNSKIKIERTIFDGNKGKNAAHLYIYANTLTVDNCIFSNGKSEERNTVYVNCSENYTITNSTFENNEANTIFYSYTKGSLINSTFTGNKVQNIFYANSSENNLIHNTIIGNECIDGVFYVVSVGNTFIGNIVLGNNGVCFMGNLDATPITKYNIFSNYQSYWSLDESDMIVENSDMSGYLQILDGTYDESTGLFNPNLKDNGGFTPTVALIGTKLPNGKVINSLPLDVSNVATDQRGVERNNPACIGAYEIGCGLDADTLTIKKEPLLCRGEALTLKVSGLTPNQVGIYKYHWDLGSDVEILDSTLNAIQFKVHAKTATLPVSVQLTDICGNSATMRDTLRISGIQDISFSGLDEGGLYCKGSEPVQLTGLPQGGTFKGEGIVDGRDEFDPSRVAGNETIIRYEIMEPDGCFSYDEKPVRLSQADPDLNLVLVPEAVKSTLCYGEKGALRFTVAGGNGDYLYSVNGNTPVSIGTDSIELTPLAPGEYNIEAWLANDKCAGTASYSVRFTETEALHAAYQSQGASCAAAEDGVIQASAAGGTAPYAFALEKDSIVSNTETSSLFEGLTAGTYQLIVSDANGCRTSEPAEVQNLNLPALTLTIISNKDQTCYGQNNGEVTVSYEGNTSNHTVITELMTTDGVVFASETSDSQQKEIHFAEVVPNDYIIQTYYASASECLTDGAKKEISISAMPTPLSIELLNQTDLTCLNEPDGNFTIIVDGWSDSHTAQLNGVNVPPTSMQGENQALFIFRNLGKGNHLFTVENECKTDYVEKEVEIKGISPYQLTLVSISDKLPCSADNAGYVELKVEGGNKNANYLYQENESAKKIFVSRDTTVRFDHLSAGAYRFYYTSAESVCSDKAMVESVIEAPQPLQIQTSFSGKLCFDAAITATATGETGPYRYEWLTPSNDTIRTEEGRLPVFSVGEYICKVTDARECSVIQQKVVVSPESDLPELAFNNMIVKNETCYKGNNGSVTVYYDSNTENETVTMEVFDNGKTVGSASSNAMSGTLEVLPLAPGNYTLLLHYGAEGCMLSDKTNNASFTVTEMESSISFTSHRTTDLTCLNEPNGSVTAAVKGWADQHIAKLNETEVHPQSVENSVATFVLTGLPKGNYRFSVENECGTDSSELNVSIDGIEPYEIILTPVVDNLVCSRDTAGSLILQITGGNKNANRFYLDGEKGIVLSRDTTIRYDHLHGGSYRYNYRSTDNACSDQVVAEQLIQAPEPLNVQAKLTGELCKDAAVSLTVTGETAPYEYEWISSSGDTTQTVESYLPVSSVGNYTYRVKDALGCSAVEDVFEVSIGRTLPKLELTGTVVKDETCYMGNNGAVTVSYANNTGNESVTVDVMDSGGKIVGTATGNLSSGSLKVSSLAPGKYSVSLRYGMKDCTLSTDTESGSFEVKKMETQITIGDPQIKDLTCLNEPNGSFTVKVTGWANQHTATLDAQTVRPSSVEGQEATFSIENLRAGNYFFSVRNECGTDESDTKISIKGIDPYLIKITATHDSLDCSYSKDGYIEVLTSGGYQDESVLYMINKEEAYEGPDNITARFDSLARGTYSIIYKTTQEGCTDSYTLKKYIYAPQPILFATDTLPVSCFGLNDGQINVLPYRAGTNWESNINILVTAKTKPSDWMKINSEFTYQWLKIDDKTGEAETFNAKELKFPLETFWKDFEGDTIYAGSIGADSLVAGNYICRVTDLKQCHFEVEVPVYAPPYNKLEIKSITFDAKKAACKAEDRRVEINVSGGWGGYIYSILTTEEYANAMNPNNDDDDDDDGIGIGSGSQLDDDEDDGSVTEFYEGDDQHGYYKSPILQPGDYYVFVTDSLGCRADETRQITVDPNVKLNARVDSVRCPGDSSGVVVLMASGGVPPYTYEMGDGKDKIEMETDSVKSGLPKGIYAFYAIDHTGCSGYNTFEILDEKPPFVLFKNKEVDVTCYGKNDGEILFLLSGGTVPYTYSIVYPDRIEQQETATPKYDEVRKQTYYDISSLSGGTYTLHATDFNGCVKSLNFEINEPDTLEITGCKATSVCPGENEGRIIVQEVSGGTKPYLYALDNGGFSSNSTLRASANVSHTVYVQDANGCETSVLKTINNSNATGKAAPSPDFIVSSWRYASDVLAIIDISEQKPDSVHFYFDNDQVVESDARIYTYGVMDKDTLIALSVGISDSLVANSRKPGGSSLEKVLQQYQQIYPEEVIRRMTFVKVIFDSTLNAMKPASDSILFSHPVRMVAYYDGCDYEVSRNLNVANDNYEIYPEGKISTNQQDILNVSIAPNPISRGGEFTVYIEFSSKVDFTISIHDTDGKEIVAGKLFDKSEINPTTMKASIESSKLGKLQSASILQVTTKFDRASTVILVKD